MKYRITRPDRPVHAAVQLPASKSISNRLLVIHEMAGVRDSLQNLSDSDDTVLLMKALQAAETEKDIGHGGTAMRFLTAYYAAQPGRDVVMTGSARMKQRPIGPLVDALRTLGADIRYMEGEGTPPLRISGKPLKGGKLSIDSTISSQFISAILMIGPLLENGLELTLKGKPVSTTYINMTLRLMEENGAEVEWEGNQIRVATGRYRSGMSRIEADWSAAAFWYSIVMLSRHGRVYLADLNAESLQGDRIVASWFSQLGVISEFADAGVRLDKLAEVVPAKYTADMTPCPDLVQAMAVALCCSGIPFHFTGTQTLRVKETDRIDALQKELRKLGYMLESDPGGFFLAWNGETCDPEAEICIETYHDHRMAMAFAPAALQLGSIDIHEPEVVTKSYPRFWDDLREAGFDVREMQ